jgi:hypothetical protein
MRPVTFSMPFLPPSLNVYRNDHWRKQRAEEKIWKDCIALKWAELGRPKLKAVRINMVFTFPDRRSRDLDNYLATGSKLVGDAVKGCFIPDDSPEHLTGWGFRFEFGKKASTTVVIEDADEKTNGQVSTGRLPGRQTRVEEAATGRPACTLYEECVAPMCPLDQSSLKGIWYPDEDICRSRVHGNLPWMKAQRKLVRVSAVGYFTVEMLRRLIVIRQGITGLDPDLPEEPQLRAWFQKRAGRQDAPKEVPAERTRHLKKYRFRKQGVRDG